MCFFALRSTVNFPHFTHSLSVSSAYHLEGYFLLVFTAINSAFKFVNTCIFKKKTVSHYPEWKASIFLMHFLINASLTLKSFLSTS